MNPYVIFLLITIKSSNILKEILCNSVRRGVNKRRRREIKEKIHEKCDKERTMRTQIHKYDDTECGMYVHIHVFTHPRGSYNHIYHSPPHL